MYVEKLVVKIILILSLFLFANILNGVMLLSGLE